jgi:pyruvate dehydrogenase E1 component alpha subunit
VARARRGEGPTLIEAKTYRYYGHFEGDTILYRTREELDAYRQRDPIGVLRRYILDHSIASEQELDAINDRVQARLEQAWERAEAAPWPAPEEALEDVYVSYEQERVR